MYNYLNHIRQNPRLSVALGRDTARFFDGPYSPIDPFWPGNFTYITLARPSLGRKYAARRPTSQNESNIF